MAQFTTATISTEPQPSSESVLRGTTKRRLPSVLATVEEAIEDLRAGKFIIIADDEDRENEGDLVMAAEFVTAAHINFLAKHARGLICMPMTRQRIDHELRIPMMASSEEPGSKFGTPFTVSVEARYGVTTGVSAADRARTVSVLLNPSSTSEDVVFPGHLFPLRAHDGGVLERRGQTEATVDLCQLAGLMPAGVLCEMMRADGQMMRRPDLKRFARRHGIRIVTVDQVVRYRRVQNEST